MTTLVIGYGNRLRGDDAAGVLVAERLRARLADLSVVTVHQLVPELAAEIAAAGLVVFVDAGASGCPGEVSCEPIRPALDARFDHAPSAAALLRLAQDTYGAAPAAWLVRIEGADFAFGSALSPAVEEGVPAAFAAVMELVTAEPPATSPA